MSIKNFIRRRCSRFKPKRTSVLLFASPRGGSTWLTEMIFSQPGFCVVPEPLNVRRELPSRALATSDFGLLHGEEGLRRIVPYYQQILQGQKAEFLRMPFQKWYRFSYDRCVLKQNQAAGDLLGELERQLDLKIIHLVRHPIAVALSREVHPLLASYSHSPLRDAFSDHENQLADRLIARGDHLERGVLAWCLHHVPAFRHTQTSWLTLSYETAVLDPDQTIRQLTKFLSVNHHEKMLRAAEKPSNVARKSDANTREILNSGEGRGRLVAKWRESVDSAEEARLLEILDQFGCEVYRQGKDLPLFSLSKD